MRLAHTFDIAPGFPVHDSFREETRYHDPGLRYVRPWGAGQLVLMCHAAEPADRPFPDIPRYVYRLERVAGEKRSVSRVFATNETRDADAFMQLMGMVKGPEDKVPALQAIFLDRHPRIVQAYLLFMDVDPKEVARHLLNRRARGNCELRSISAILNGPEP